MSFVTKESSGFIQAVGFDFAQLKYLTITQSWWYPYIFQDNTKWSFKMDEQLMSWATTRPEVTMQLSGISAQQQQEERLDSV